MALEGCGWGAGAASLAVGEVGLEEFEGVGHVGPAEADPDVVWLVVDRAREEQYADLGEPRIVSGEVTDARDAGQSLLESMNRVLCSYWA